MEANNFARRCLETAASLLAHKSTVAVMAAAALASTQLAGGPGDETAHAQQPPAYDLPGSDSGLSVDIGRPAAAVYTSLPFSYKIKLANSGPNDTQNSVVAIAPPAGYEGSVRSQNTACTQKDTVFLCPVRSLAVGSKAVFSLAGQTTAAGHQQTKATVYDTAGSMLASDSQPITINRRPSCGGKLATLIGTTRQDLLIGTNGSDVIVGLGGNDYIRGGAGSDVICGNNGDDEIVGGSGTDKINGASGADWCQDAENISACESNRSLRRIPGTSRKQGRGRLVTYQVLIERGIGINAKATAEEIDSILGDKRGWTRSGRVAFQRVRSNASTQVILATPKKVDALCAPLSTGGRLSCRQGNRIILNLNRWRYAVDHWPKNSVKTYRQMVVNHEMGHRLGFGHSTCTGSGNRAPVMQQQTKFLLGCRANPWPLTGEVAGL